MDNRFIIDNLLRQNMNERLEFKSQFDFSTAAQLITAMLNTNGGDIIFGVDEQKKIHGISTDIDATKLQQQLITTIKPTAPISVSTFYYDEKQVLLINVWEGSQKPYIFEGKFYHRSADNTQQSLASPNDIQQMIKERTIADYNWERKTMLNVDIDDLDIQELHNTKEAYQKQLDIKDLSDEDFLLRCGLMQNGDLTNACVVLYAKNPIQYIPQIGIKMSVYNSDNLADLANTKLFENNLFKNINDIFEYFDTTYSKSIQISSHIRNEKWNYPRIAIRETIMNALVHKDYSIPSAITNIRIFPNRLEIQNSGILPHSLSFEEMEQNSYSILRNPDIAHQCYYRGLIEMMGTGIARIKQDCVNNHFSTPTFTEENNIIKVTFQNLEHKITEQPHTIDFASILNIELHSYNDEVIGKLIDVLTALQSNQGLRISSLQNKINIPAKTLERYVKILKEINLIEYRGSKKTGGYYLTNALTEGINKGINKGINEGINEGI